MSFYTPEEFQKFLSVENDVEFICAFQTLFYCGLRNGELRGLTWNDITFKKSCLSVNKNITKTPDPITGKPYTLSISKTMSSYRTIPIPNFLLEYYKIYMMNVVLTITSMIIGIYLVILIHYQKLL